MLERSVLQSTPTVFIAIILFILITAFHILGHRVRRYIIKRNADHSKLNFGQINGTLLALLGLLLAFSFSMSNSRFDTRRDLIIEEANSIGTVISRTDIYPDSIRRLLRVALKEYLEARIDYYHAGQDIVKTNESYNRGDAAGKRTWSIVANYARLDQVTTHTSQMIPALNEMIDISATRQAANEATIPESIIYFLFVICVCAAFLLGYDQNDKMDWIIMMGFSIMLSATIYNILDLDRPRSGLINMDDASKKIIELRNMFEGD